MLYFGLDWGRANHSLCVMNELGVRLSQRTIPHTLQGFAQIEEQRLELGAAIEQCLVGIESPHNLLVDYLLDRGYSIYIIPPSATESYRKRQRSSGAYTDQSDAAALANAVRTDSHLLRRWWPNEALTQQILAQVRLARVLSVAIQRQRSQLEAVLWRAYPVACTLFSSLRTKIALEFLMAYPTINEGQALSQADFEQFCRQHGYRRGDLISQRYRQLQEVAEVPATVAIVYREQVRTLAQVMLPQIECRQQAVAYLQMLFEQHSDHALYASLPGAAEILAPALLAKLGDHRGRFENAEQVQSLAGTCPVTRKSGSTHHVVRFREACDREFRYYAQQYAFVSLKRSGWAMAYWQEARLRGARPAHATRMLANRWLGVLWKMWQTHRPYDEGYHLRQRALRSAPPRRAVS